MSDLLLHSYRRCPFAIRVRMVLEEKALPYTVFEEDLGNLSPELMRLHPEGKVPLLLVGGPNGVPIHESSVITEYLEDRFPTPQFLPSDPLVKAQVRLWTHWSNELLKPDLDSFKYEWKDLTPDLQDALLTRLKLRISELKAALAAGPFLMGDAFTLADIHVFPFYRQLQKSRPDFQALLGDTAVVDAWLDRIVSRPSFERVMRVSKKPEAKT